MSFNPHEGSLDDDIPVSLNPNKEYKPHSLSVQTQSNVPCELSLSTWGISRRAGIKFFLIYLLICF